MATAKQVTKNKLRCRQVDPLKDVLLSVEHGDLDGLKTQLKSDAKKKLFKERLLEDRVPKDHSPLVITTLKNNFEVFKYILDNFGVNLEQETAAIVEGGYPVEGATPLWSASTLGRIDFVKVLLARGANIEHTTESRSTPLRGAAFDGHCEVCEFLLDQGADIDKPNQVGQSPLTIAAAMQKDDCVNLLISKGANVNHKGHNGDTPLHVSVESGAVEIAKVLVEAGAKNCPNDVGFTPATLACCYGHDKVMEFLHTTFHLQVKELYDCYCLLAAKDILGNNDSSAETWMTKAITIRQQHPETFGALPLAASLYDGLQEPAKEEDLQMIMQDETRMFFVSSIYCERILGRVHPTTAFYIRISGDMALAEERYSKCVELWHRSFEFDGAARMAYELQITEDLLFSIRGFSIMSDNNYIPSVEPHFRWGLKEFRLAHESKISEVDVVCCLSRMVAVWIKVSEMIKDNHTREKEKELISKAVEDLIRIMEGNQWPLLVACLQNLPSSDSGASKDIMSAQLPLHKVLALLLDHGCSVHCEDKDGNFPLHLAVKLKEDSALNCVKMLLEYGAHPDAVNYDGQTALDIARNSTDNSQSVTINQELEKASLQYVSLQCLASRAVASHGIQYADILPQSLVQFVSWHESDK